MLKAPITCIKASKNSNGICIPVVTKDGNWDNLFVPLGDVPNFVAKLNHTLYLLTREQLDPTNAQTPNPNK